MTLALPASLTPGESGPIAKARSAQPPVATAPTAGGPRVTCSCGSMRCMRHGEIGWHGGSAARWRCRCHRCRTFSCAYIRVTCLRLHRCARGRFGEAGDAHMASVLVFNMKEAPRARHGGSRTQHLGPKKPSSGVWEDEAQQAGRDGKHCSCIDLVRPCRVPR
jgi:hypothetical protein